MTTNSGVIGENDADTRHVRDWSPPPPRREQQPTWAAKDLKPQGYVPVPTKREQFNCRRHDNRIKLGGHVGDFVDVSIKNLVLA